MTVINGLFVTGTDTGVGKTAITAGLAGYLRSPTHQTRYGDGKGHSLDVGVMKPIATGAVQRDGKLISSDAVFLKTVSGVPDLLYDICPLVYALPTSPEIASRGQSCPVDLELIRTRFRKLSERHAAMLVEGVGGWRVPLCGKFTVRELAVELGMPVLVVGRSSIGTINHCVLTVEAIRRARLNPAGVVLVRTTPGPPDPSEATNAEQIESLGEVKVLGTVPYDPGVNVEENRPGDIVTNVGKHVDLESLLPLFGG